MMPDHGEKCQLRAPTVVLAPFTRIPPGLQDRGLE
jgi:hypothetical protein